METREPDLSPIWQGFLRRYGRVYNAEANRAALIEKDREEQRRKKVAALWSSK